MLTHNGPVLSLARVSALFHCPPLNNITKIKLSQQTTKPRVELEHVLYVVVCPALPQGTKIK